MGTISISETPLVTLTGTYEWPWTTSQWKIEADTVGLLAARKQFVNWLHSAFSPMWRWHHFNEIVAG